MINSRALIIIFFIFLLFAILIAKLAEIQIIKSEELKYLAERQQTKIEKIKSERGLIFDRNNVLLVYNRNDISFYVDSRMTSNKSKEKIAEKFSSVFGKSKKHYLNLMKKPATVCIEKKAPGDKAILLKDFKVEGLFHREDPTRIYQYENFASHILGFVGNEYSGITGVEKSFEKSLKGEDGIRIVERNAVGDMITIEESETKSSEPGNNLFLTIDKEIQTILEEELKSGLQKYGGTSAIGIIMNPGNGDIIALANMNDYDPNNYSAFSDEIRRNKSITDTYEPGSTFKSIVLAALLDKDLCKENELLFVENGKFKFKNIIIRDTHEHDYLTVKGIIEQSSNIGMAKLVQRIDNETLYKYLRGFGFGNYTSAPLPGEAKGILRKPTDWSALSKSSISYGYEISVTPLQLITAYSALINGGILYKPQILKKEISNDGKIIFESEPKEIRRVISEKTSERIRKILKSVVENGTAKTAKINGISVGGKTGTSRKYINGNYSTSHYNTSFIGFFPAENPEFICLILINSPSNGIYGSFVAAPVFKNITEKIITLKEKKPVEEKENFPSDIKIIYADMKNEEDNELEIKPVKNISDFEYKENNEYMPDLTDYYLRDAISILSKLGIKYKINGSGRVVSQSLIPGSKINKEKICIITCSEIKVNGTAVY